MSNQLWDFLAFSECPNFTVLIYILCLGKGPTFFPSVHGPIIFLGRRGHLKNRHSSQPNSFYIRSVVRYLYYLFKKHYTFTHLHNYNKQILCYRTALISKHWKFRKQNCSFYLFINPNKLKTVIKSARNLWAQNCQNGLDIRFCFIEMEISL